MRISSREVNSNGESELLRWLLTIESIKRNNEEETEAVAVTLKVANSSYMLRIVLTSSYCFRVGFGYKYLNDTIRISLLTSE